MGSHTFSRIGQKKISAPELVSQLLTTGSHHLLGQTICAYRFWLEDFSVGIQLHVFELVEHVRLPNRLIFSEFTFITRINRCLCIRFIWQQPSKDFIIRFRTACILLAFKKFLDKALIEVFIGPVIITMS